MIIVRLIKHPWRVSYGHHPASTNFLPPWRWMKPFEKSLRFSVSWWKGLVFLVVAQEVRVFSKRCMSGKSQKMIILSEKEKKKEKHVGVSKNRGTPKSSILIGFSYFGVPLFLETPMYPTNCGFSCGWFFSHVGLQSHRWTKVWGEAFRKKTLGAVATK